MKKLLTAILIILMVPLAAGTNLSGYNRRDWKHWLDIDKDCQNLRAELLIDKSMKPVKFRSERKCVVDKGVWMDPYTTTPFTSASKIHIDHVVPLKNAHDSGGARWNKKQKSIFANDPLNLLAVSARENMSKGARTPDQWKPKNRKFWCKFANRWIFIKKKYNLSGTAAEKTALATMLKECK